MVGNFVPKCRVTDGLYANKQCHGSTGECWCANPNTGKEIPNTRKGPGQGQVKCRSKYMSQRKKWNFLLRISSVNVTKSAGIFKFGYIC